MHKLIRFDRMEEMNIWLKDYAMKIRVKDINVVVNGSYALFFVHYTLPDPEVRLWKTNH